MIEAALVIGLVGLVLAVVVLYGHGARKQGAAEERIEEAEGNAKVRAEVAEILAERPDRESARERIRRLLDKRRARRD